MEGTYLDRQKLRKRFMCVYSAAYIICINESFILRQQLLNNDIRHK